MPSPILEAMPSVHATVIGLGGAFYSAFAIYGYQQLQEAKDNLDRVLDEVQDFSTLNNYIADGRGGLFTDQGELDWDGVKRVFLDVKSKFPYLDYEEKYGFTSGGDFREPSETEVTEACKKLCVLFHYIFASYPFHGKSMVHIDGITDSLEERKQGPMDQQRLAEIERRISFLQWCWETSSLSLLELAKRATQSENTARYREHLAMFERNLESTPGLPESEKERIWKQFHLPHLIHSVDYGRIITDFFEKVSAYQKNVLPVLRESLRVHDLYNIRFRIKQRSLFMVALTVFVLLFGVLLPPAMASAREDFSVCWPAYVEYLLLAGTSVPYFLICAWLWWSIRKLSFQ